MNVAPLTTTRWKPVALCFPGHRRLTVLTASGRRDATGKRAIEELLGRLRTHVCYVSGALTSLRHTSGATSWSCHQWRNRGTRMIHEPSGTAFTSLRSTLAGSPEAQWDDLQLVLHWLRGYGVAPGSISGMAWNLWRASLSRTVQIGFDPEISRAAFYGGRQEVREPRVYQHMVSADIMAAYPTAMASAPYGVSLRSVSPQTALDPSVPGLAEASVRVPHDMPFGPLPVRLAPGVISFQTGPVQGVWSWCELDAAHQLGCEVRVSTMWAPRSTLDLFGAWWSIAQHGRALPTPGAQSLAKCLTTALWGQFAMNGESRSVTRWVDDQGKQPFTIDQDPRRMPHAWTTHIAAETTSRVRTRLLLEGLYGTAPGTRGYPVHADTDGTIMRSTNAVPTPVGNSPGHWRIKSAMRRVDIRAPQLYRWTCGKGCGVTHAKWHYVAAGVPAGMEEHVFEQTAHTPIAHRGMFDMCVPGCHSGDVRQVAQLVLEAKALAHA